MIAIKSQREIGLMRETCRLAAKVLDYIAPFVKPKVSTQELNDLCHAFILEQGAIPSPLNYKGYPKSICTSLNNVICHGIPSHKDKLKEGDILNIDITTYYKGMHGDTSRMFFVGEVSPQRKQLVEHTYQAMMKGIEVVGPGKRVGDIGHAIESFLAPYSYGIVTDFCGHGIGRNFHEPPQILHRAKPNTGEILKEGMTFTIEPMINMGTYKTKMLSDGWTVITADGKDSAQFEHTILVTSSGYEILTVDSQL